MRQSAVVRVFGTMVMALALLLVIAPVALAIAVQQHVVAPPASDLELGTVHIVAYSTRYPGCPPRMPCSREIITPPQAYYLVWLIDETATADQPYGWTARRLLMVPLSG